MMMLALPLVKSSKCKSPCISLRGTVCFPQTMPLRSANNGETVRIYFKNGHCKAAPTNSAISGMFTARAVGAQ